MRILFNFLTVLFSLLAAVAILRTIELLITGAGMLPVQFLIAVIMLLLAGGCSTKAQAIVAGMHVGRRRHVP